MPSRLAALRNEMRSLHACNEYEGFVLVEDNYSGHWAYLFDRYFLSEQFKTAYAKDDLIFFVRGDSDNQWNDLSDVKYKVVDVFRIGSRRVPRPFAPNAQVQYDWRDSAFINTVLHEFDYSVTMVVSTVKPDGTGLDLAKKISKRVSACPVIRQMKDGDEKKMVYPTVEFIADTADDQGSILLDCGQVVCVELVGQGHDSVRLSFFLGSVKKETLRRVLVDRERNEQSLRGALWRRLMKPTREQGRSGGEQVVIMKEPRGRGTAQVSISLVPPATDNGGTSVWRQSIDCFLSSEVTCKRIDAASTSQPTGVVLRRSSLTSNPLNWLSNELLSRPLLSPSDPSTRFAVRLTKISISCESIVNDMLSSTGHGPAFS